MRIEPLRQFRPMMVRHFRIQVMFEVIQVPTEYCVEYDATKSPCAMQVVGSGWVVLQVRRNQRKGPTPEDHEGNIDRENRRPRPRN